MTTPLHRNTYEQGREDGKAESAETIRKLREALDKALAENLALRSKPTHLDAVSRQGCHGAVAR